MKGELISQGPKTGCGCCTGLTLECPVLAVSPFTESVLTVDFHLTLILSLMFFILNSAFAGNVVIEINFC